LVGLFSMRQKKQRECRRNFGVGDRLIYAARTRNGFTPAIREDKKARDVARE